MIAGLSGAKPGANAGRGAGAVQRAAAAVQAVPRVLLAAAARRPRPPADAGLPPQVSTHSLTHRTPSFSLSLHCVYTHTPNYINSHIHTNSLTLTLIYT